MEGGTPLPLVIPFLFVESRGRGGGAVEGGGGDEGGRRDAREGRGGGGEAGGGTAAGGGKAGGGGSAIGGGNETGGGGEEVFSSLDPPCEAERGRGRDAGGGIERPEGWEEDERVSLGGRSREDGEGGEEGEEEGGRGCGLDRGEVETGNLTGAAAAEGKGRGRLRGGRPELVSGRGRVGAVTRR